MRRRIFVATATAAGTALAVGASSGPPRRVGMPDVDRLQAKLDELIVDDHRHGGTPVLETRALAYAQRALGLQQVATVSQRVRGHLYRLAASFTNTAMWAAFDARRPEQARQYLDRTVTLAGLSGDSVVQHRTWLRAAMLAGQRGRWTDAIAAIDAARGTAVARRDPLFASLTHAQAGSLYAYFGNRNAAFRSLEHARDALARAHREEPRPLWLLFYDQAELEGLSTIACLQLGEAEEAEAGAHRTLALLRPGLHRNRALYTAQLALAQLAQGALEPAVATARTIPSDMVRCSGRVERLLDGFGRRLNAQAPRSPGVHIWRDHRMTIV